MKNETTKQFEEILHESGSTFIEKLQDEIQGVFPESYVAVRLHKGMSSTPAITIDFTIGKDKSEYAHSIINNDAMHTTIWIWGCNADGSASEKMSVESSSGSFYTKPPAGSYLAFGRVKTGWRNFKGNEQQVLRKVGDYFNKAKMLLLENFDILTEDTQKLVAQKYK